MPDKYVFSTLASDQLYTGWKKGGGDLPNVEKQVFIAGKAGVQDKVRLFTPLGVMTKVPAEDVKWLEETNDVFKRHVKNGFIKVQDAPADADNVAADMERNDPSRQLTHDDYVNVNETEAKPRKDHKRK